MCLDRSIPIRKKTQRIPTLIIAEQNETLLKRISIEEVDQAIKEILAGKSPRPDGFTTDFLHHC
jgi:hypothetical protein